MDTDTYRTNDMALVTFLRMQGHSVQEVRWEDQTCYWFFMIIGTLTTDLDAYTGGTARVEPKEYNRVFGRTKREFYDSQPQQDAATR